MKMQRHSRSRRGSRTLPSLITAFALITGFGVPAAFAGGGGSSTPGGAPTAGDDVTTLPMIAAGGASGTVLFGQEIEILQLIRTVRGHGHIEVLPRGEGEIAVAFVGDWNLRFRRSVLETTRVRVAFVAGTAFEDAHARLRIGDSRPVSLLLTHPTLDVPLASLAGGGSQGVAWDFLARSAAGESLREAAFFGTDTVTLFQRTSF